jgi:hypothetical protein
VSISCVKDESGPLGPQNKNPLSEVKSPVPGGSLPRLSGDELEAHASSVKESAPAVKTVETVQPVETGSELARKDPAKQVGSLLGFACADESLKLELFTLVRNHFTRKDVVPVMDGSDGEIRLRKDLAATLDDGLAASPFGGRNDAPGEASTICRARQSCADRKDTREFVFELFQTEIEDMPSGGSGPFFRRVLRAAQKGELKPANTLMRIFRREVLDGLFEDIDACIEGRMEILNAWSKFIKSKSAVWNLTSSLT